MTKNKIFSLIVLALIFVSIFGCSSKNQPKEKIKVLILPKFEVDKMYGDFPGEAQLFYEHYLTDSKEYEIKGGYQSNKLYVKDGIALYVTGMGKVNTATSLCTLLNCDKIDLSESYILGTGCAGGAFEECVMGDVCIVTAVVDYDLGHNIDIRDMENQKSQTTWFYDESYFDSACVFLNEALTEKAFNLTKDISLETTEKTKKYLEKNFHDSWALRNPKVLKGTTVTSDNYWKGKYAHNNAVLITKTYKCPDNYVSCEMEDIALARVCKRYNILDKLIIVRDIVDMDVFTDGNTPESLWAKEESSKVAVENSEESADIFVTAGNNNFKVCKAIIDELVQ